MILTQKKREMTRKSASNRELLSRWRAIEEEEDQNDDVDDPLKLRLLHHRKEEWFADAFDFLIDQPKEKHIWCDSWEIMGPLLETFYNYFKDERSDSPLRFLWKRISEEMRQCIQCISQHHQAQETYNMEFEPSCVGPLLDVLRALDEERITQHLREINARLKRDEYDPLCDNAEVVSLMYEVLMFPVLLDDLSLFTEFELFIEAVDNMHELALAGHQHFPGVYALLFFNRRARTIGRRLARSMEKLRRAIDLEPLQPLLNKFIGFLETEVLPSASKTSRPRAQLERQSIWLGIASLLEFLEPPAFEEGILEHYPIFFDIVLNHISGDSTEFSHAVSCLKELFKMLGCKLWLRSTLSPSVMRNTLLGQCFHTRNEKIHKDIFDLFLPFLQSLEALQDGEHEKQRRNFLYFLLHQVPVSNNFNPLTRKMACKIALLIIHRGYKMNPPSPPFECAHMWGPSLVSSLKDSSLHSSLRQPAFDLIRTIIVSDAAALVTSMLNDCASPGVDKCIYAQFSSDDDAGLLFAPDVEEQDNSCWGEFSVQDKLTSYECRGWMCIPMLWIDVLVDIDPAVLPVSFSKAVFWARSRLTMLEPETSAEMELAVRTWLSSSATEISSSFGWKVPTGCDDGGGGKDSKNSIKLSLMHLPLIKTFSRLTAHFVVQMGQGELRKQWTWEPRMAESLILSLLDPNDNVRQFGKCILEQVSDTRGLASGLKFLCSSGPSLSSIFLGFRHALKVVQLDSVILKFQALQHFFFVLCKLIKEGDSPSPEILKKSSDYSNVKKYSSQGGFLTQLVVDSLPASIGQSSNSDLKSHENFRYLLSQTAWPSVQKCLVEGKAFIDQSLCQMTCVRVLEILPVVFERLFPSLTKHPGTSQGMVDKVFDFIWLHDLIDWGKSSLKVVVVYWKRTVTSILNQLKGYCHNAFVSTAIAIEKLISCDTVNIDHLTEQVSRLRVSLAKEVFCDIRMPILRPQGVVSEGLINLRSNLVHDMQQLGPKEEDVDLQILDAVSKSNRRDKSNLIVLSDDESEKQNLPSKVIASNIDSRKSLLDGKKLASTADKNASQAVNAKKKVSITDSSRNLLNVFQLKDVLDRSCLTLEKDFDKLRDKLPASPKSKGEDDKTKEIKSVDKVDDSSQHRINLSNSSDEADGSKSMHQVCNSKVAQTSDSVLKEIVSDTNVDQQESTVKSIRQKLYLPKLGASGPKRQVIQLKTPVENRFGTAYRLLAGVKRFKPPRLDDWYRPILEIDYFALVGLTSASENKNQNVSKLKEVPLCFQSPEQYVSIFRPLVLEEFKAQLLSSFQEMSSWEEMHYGTVSVMSVERIDDFHLVRFVHDDDDYTSSRILSENDLVLLTKEAPDKRSSDFHVVGKVERRERDSKRRSCMLLIRFYFLNGSPRLNQARKQLVERSKWHASRIMSITPQLREFQALSSIKDIPILSVILKPVNDAVGDNESREPVLDKLSQPLQQILKSSFNKSQLQAISITIGMSNSKKDFELSLIQGPPGTGKTRTIVAIVSGLLASVRETNKSSLNGHSKESNISFINTRRKVSPSVAIARAWQDAALARQLNEDVGRNEKSLGSSVKRRVLICAQSNAAVDELVSRISGEGLYGSDGKMYKPYLVRVGNAKTVHPNSLPFFIDTLVDHRLVEERMHSSDAMNDSTAHSSIALRSNLEKLVDRIRFYEAKRASLRDGKSDLRSLLEDETQKGVDVKEMSDAELEVNLRKLYEQKKQIYKELSAAQTLEKKTNEEFKALRHKLRKSILKEAEIVVATLSGCGGDLYGVCSESMSSKFGIPSEHTLFDAVVIDEAAQALEPATLIPLQLLKSIGTKCVMVGDPKQLPATVLSNVASKFLFECSMFERLQRAGHPVTMLNKQYRMHPEICQFPSLHFYDNKLLNGEELSSKSAPFHETYGLGPYVFYDIIDGQELRGKNSGASSLYNEREAEAAVELLKFFKRRFPSEFVNRRIGIITPYKCQLSHLRSRFSSAFGSSIVNDMELNTVDGFQGREVDILILSTVRAADTSKESEINSSNIGFVADVKRMNVALTRAKISLWILGNARTLRTNHNWASLVKDAKVRNLMISTKRPYESLFRTTVRDSCPPENSDKYSRQQKHVENVSDTGKLANQNDVEVRPTLHKNAEHFHSATQCNRTVSKDANKFSMKEVRSSKRRATDAHPSIDADGENTSLKNATYVDKVMDGETKGGRRREKKSGNSHIVKTGDKCFNSKSTLDCSGQEASDGPNIREANKLKASHKSFERDRSRKNLKVSTSSTEGSQKAKDVGHGAPSSHMGTAEDLITKRKQQREAVDAILYSSLISSKKSEQSKRSAPSKRPLSPSSIARGGIKPPKTKKGTSVSSKYAAKPGSSTPQ